MQNAHLRPIESVSAIEQSPGDLCKLNIFSAFLMHYQQKTYQSPVYQFFFIYKVCAVLINVIIDCLYKIICATELLNIISSSFVFIQFNLLLDVCN